MNENERKRHFSESEATIRNENMGEDFTRMIEKHPDACYLFFGAFIYDKTENGESYTGAVANQHVSGEITAILLSISSFIDEYSNDKMIEYMVDNSQKLKSFIEKKKRGVR